MQLNCPKCQGDMAKITYAGIEVDRCAACGGLWFDMLEHESLKVIEGSEEIESDEPARGRAVESRDPIHCPVCRTRMLRMVDARQPHIRYESCKVCYGVFFDRGEFRDYKQETVVDFVRDLWARARRSGD